MVIYVGHMYYNMAVSIRFTESEMKLIREYGQLYNLNQSEVIRKATMQMIEDELDVQLLETSIKRIESGEMKLNSFEDVGRKLGFL